MPYTQTRVIDGKSVKIGSFVFRKRFQGVGEIRLQSGTNDTRIFKQYEVAVQDLFANGNLDALIALKEKRCSLRDIYAWWRDKTQTPPWLHDAQTHEPLFEQLRGWLELPQTKARLQATTRVGYLKCVNMLEASCTDKNADVGDLPKILAAFRDQCVAANPPKARSFNQTRAALLSFARQTTEKSSPFYQSIRDIDVITENVWAKKKVNNPILPSEIDAAFVNNTNKRLRDVVWFLCVTGMTPKEFLDDGWEVDASQNAIRIFGRKRSGRYNRLVPRVYQKLTAETDWTYRQLLEAFKEVFPNRNLYDLRRTFAVWNNRAGIDVLHTKAYMGHGANITERYMAQNVAGWLIDDAAKLSTFIARARTEAPDVSDERLTLPETPEQLARTLQDERLEYFRGLLDEQLAKWYREGKMRRAYKVAQLVAADDRSQQPNTKTRINKETNKNLQNSTTKRLK
jgi:hypothetical protein